MITINVQVSNDKIVAESAGIARENFITIFIGRVVEICINEQQARELAEQLHEIVG